MPELPEVETVRRGLVKAVKDATIVGVTIYWERIIMPPFSKEQFAKCLINETIHDIHRRGKYLIFILDHWALISHLRMEGKYSVTKAGAPLEPHTHLIFHLADNRELRYQDVRKFGRMTLVPLPKVWDYFGKKNLGPEPIPEFFKLEEFKEQLKKHQGAIKPLLLNQKIVAGLGNIYTDEVLFQARIYPERPANSLSSKEVTALYQAIIAILKDAIAKGGSTVRTYKNMIGADGTYQMELKVYGRTGLPCVRCGALIEKIKVNQRGTHFCPVCQPKEGQK